MSITGVIIAGGKSKRMGKDKLFLLFKGKTLLANAEELLENIVTDILISTNHKKLQTTYPIINDPIKDIGPIAGIYQALQKSRTQKIIVIPVDMPLLNIEILQFLLKNTKCLSVYMINGYCQLLKNKLKISIINFASCWNYRR